MKYIFYSTLNYLGLLEWRKRQKLKGKGFILTYHRVLDDSCPASVFVQPGMFVSVKTLRTHLLYLKEQFTILPLAELLQKVEHAENIENCCAITFDDGWTDNYSNAFPVLKELNIPATIFLATGFIGTTKLAWPELLTFYLGLPEVRASIGDDTLLSSFVEEIGLCGSEENFLNNAIESFKYIPIKRQQIIMELLSAKCKQPLPNSQYLSWEQVREMQSSGLISFGAHTVNHVILDQVSLEEAETEIAGSLDSIRKKIDVTPDYFAYPNGNYNEKLQAILEQVGFKGAVTTDKGYITKDSGRFGLPRIGMHEDISSTKPLFLAKLLK